MISQTASLRRGGADRRLLLIPVSINEKGPFYFFLDTGAPTTVISARFAQAQQIEAQSLTTGRGAAGAISAAITTLRSVAVGTARQLDMRAGIVGNFDELHRRVPEAVGSLGLDFLKDYVMTIDYAHDTVSLENTNLPNAGGLAFEIGLGVYTNVRIDGHGPFLFAIDTGASVNVIDPALALILRLPMTSAEPLPGAGGFGLIDASTAHFRSLEAGPYERRNGSMIAADVFDPLRAGTGHELAGILGQPFLGEGTVTFDFPNARLIIH
jgi:hypothetical protein